PLLVVGRGGGLLVGVGMWGVAWLVGLGVGEMVGGFGARDPGKGGTGSAERRGRGGLQWRRPARVGP
ncbi:MAG: hypothetical protein JSV79_06480, partial [Armatimonadota bacterium]